MMISLGKAMTNSLVGSALAMMTTISSLPPLELELGNGSVQLENPMIFGDEITLTNPRFLGSGGGGAVFAYSQTMSSSSSRKDTSSSRKNTKTDDDVVVKVSWVKSSQSVRNECEILRVMEHYQVSGVERCLGQKDYPSDTRRTMIAMEPVMGSDSVSSVSEIPTRFQSITVRGLVQTMVQMLFVAHVVTTDVQPLISKETGKMLLIDMTEAKVFDPNSLTSLDKALINSFCTEIVGLIPKTQWDVASETLLLELSSLWTKQEREGNGQRIRLAAEILEVLNGQSIWSQETLDYLDDLILKLR